MRKKLDPEVKRARQVARSRAYRLKNLEKCRDKDKARSLKNNPKRSAYLKEHYQKNKATIQEKRAKRRLENPDIYKNSLLKCEYGITLEKYRELLAGCKGKCPVCHRAFNKSSFRPCVDHCHNSNLVRGIICFACNIAEGQLKTPEIAFRLYQYMANNSLFYTGASNVA